MPKFHGTSHMKGGFDIDENTLDPNANYWKAGAKWAYEKITEYFLNSEVQWKDKCRMLERFVEILKLEKHNGKSI